MQIKGLRRRAERNRRRAPEESRGPEISRRRMASLRRLLAGCKHVESPNLNMEKRLTNRGRPVVGPRPMRVQVDDSIRTNRLLAVVLAVGLVAVLLSLPPPAAGAAQGLGASAPTPPRAGARSAPPPSPSPARGSSVDPLPAFGKAPRNPLYSVPGHCP